MPGAPGSVQPTVEPTAGAEPKEGEGGVEKEKDRAISPLEEGSSLYLEVHMIARLESMRQHA